MMTSDNLKAMGTSSSTSPRQAPIVGEIPGANVVDWLPATEHPELLAPRTFNALTSWSAALGDATSLIRVAAIDPNVSDTAAMSDAYDIPMSASVNCVLVAGRREGIERTAAVLVRASTRADINGAIKRMLAVRKASFVPVDRAVHDSQMEYGGITPIGLPAMWRCLIDAQLATSDEWIVIGSGVRKSKIAIPANLLATYPGILVVPGVALV